MYGIDFAPAMIELAERYARSAAVEDQCRFEVKDFLEESIDRTFDYAGAMGFMDYMEDAESVVAKILSITKVKAFFSFPAERGFLAWQRRLRYKKKCDLFLYGDSDIEKLFRHHSITIERIHRDFFVTASGTSEAAS